MVGYDTGYTSRTPSGKLLICPVKTCLFRIHSKSVFKRHWREKHEKCLALLECVVPCCAQVFKRYGDLSRHCRRIHGTDELDSQDYKLTTVYKENRQFVDPSPLTLEIVLDNIGF